MTEHGKRLIVMATADENERLCAKVASLEKENARLKETVTRLNRRCQEMESAVAEKASGCRSLGRALANAEASRLKNEVVKLRALCASVADDADKYGGMISVGHIFRLREAAGRGEGNR